eukprot:3041351-Ditylum_brightwellii.AAC.1
MMTVHWEHCDASLKELAVAFNNITGNITANSNAITSITDKLNSFNNGPHNKRQKHGNAATADVYAMGNADALQDARTGQDFTNGATGGTIETARATQTKYRSSQRKKGINL